MIGGDDGRQMIRRGLELARSNGDVREEARIAIHIGAAALEAGDYAEAVAESVRSLELLQPFGGPTPGGVITIRLNIAIASYFLGDFDAAAASLEEARKMAEALTDEGAIATSRIVEGVLAARGGDLARAALELSEAEELLSAVGVSVLEPAEERLRQELRVLLSEA
jgi:tetratricopeptide (TPR) repeat protein